VILPPIVSLDSNINSLKSGLFYLSSQPNSLKSRAKIRDGIISVTIFLGLGLDLGLGLELGPGLELGRGLGLGLRTVV